MLRFDEKAKVMKDYLKPDLGWINLNIRTADLIPYVGQTLPCHVMVDEDQAHNPKELVKMEVKREAPGFYEVHGHKVAFRPRFQCDCEFYQFSNGEVPCKHLLAVFKQIVIDKKF